MAEFGIMATIIGTVVAIFTVVYLGIPAYKVFSNLSNDTALDQVERGIVTGFKYLLLVGLVLLPLAPLGLYVFTHRK